jgi:hypothetical protein
LPPFVAGNYGLRDRSQAAPDTLVIAQMPEHRLKVDELAARLSAIDRRLGEIQAELKAPERGAPAPQSLSVSAGPFRTLDDVRTFERELSALPSVREAAVRGYEGTDRVVIDVHVGPPVRS